MGQQRVKDPEKKEEKKSKEKAEPAQTKVKKWKGKDWFAILAPEMFGQKQLAETPSTDPKYLLGRTLQNNVAELTGNPKKQYMNVLFKIKAVENGKAITRFNGYMCAREHLYRLVRKRNQKVEVINTLETKDGWKIQLTTLTVLNRNTDSTVQKKVRKKVDEFLRETAGKSSIDGFVKKIIEGSVQKSIRGMGSKIYPVRFVEISKIEVMKAPAS